MDAFVNLKNCLDSGQEADLSGQVLIAEDLRQHLLNAKCASVRMHGATIKGQLDLSWMGSSQKPLPALCFRRCSFVPDGKPIDDNNPNLNLSNAHVEGLSLVDSKFTHLRGVGSHIYGTVDLSGVGSLREDDEPCWCKLSRSTIAGDVVINRSRLFAGPGEIKTRHSHEKYEWNWALNLAMTRVGGSIFARGSVRIQGGFLIDLAWIQGDVLIFGCLTGKDDKSVSLSMESARIRGGLSLFGQDIDRPVQFVGRIWLMLTEIGGSVDIILATLKGDKSGIALYVSASSIRGEFTIGRNQATGLAYEQNRSVDVDGRIVIRETRIGGNLNIIGVNVHNAPLDSQWSWIEDAEPCALQVKNSHVEQSYKLIGNNLTDNVDLRGTRCRSLDDAPTGYQGAKSNMLDGFRYEHVNNAEWDGIKKRLTDWLPSDGEPIASRGKSTYRPQPFVQLANVLASHGDEADAWRILSKKARFDAKKRWKQQSGLVGAHLIWYPALLFYGWGFDFGLKPMCALRTLLLFVVFGAGLFGLIDSRNAFVIAATPATSFVKQDGGSLKFAAIKGPTVGNLTCGLTQDFFSQPLETLSRLLVYSTDAAIPLFDLHEEDKCEIGQVENALASPKNWEVTVYRCLRALYTVLGWIITTLAVITFSGVMRHRIERE